MLKIILLLSSFSVGNIVFSNDAQDIYPTTQENHLSQLLTLSKTNRWENVVKLTGELAIKCHPDASVKETCSEFANNFNVFVAESSLLTQNKNIIITLVKNIENEYLKNISFKLDQKKIEENKLKKQVLNNQLTSQREKKILTVRSPKMTSIFSARSIIISILVALSIAVFILTWKIVATLIDNRYLRKFQSQLFANSKKYGINLKISGNPNSHDVKTMKKISSPINMMISEAKAITNNLELKFEKKDHKLSLEVTFLTSKSLDFFSRPNMQSKLDQSLLAFQENILKHGGSLTVVTNFSKVGEIKQTTLLGVF
jgi:hypothetical protein